MTEKTNFLIHRIIGTLIAVSAIITGICFAAGCCFIYFSEDIEYSRIAVADIFTTICIPVYICLSLVVLGFVFDICLPTVNNTPKKSISSETLLVNLLNKRDLNNLSNNFLALHYREKGRRTINSLIMTVLTLISSIVFFIYALNPNNFENVSINDSMINAMFVLTPCLALPFIFYVYLLIAKESSFKRELNLLKSERSNSDISIELKEQSYKFETFDVLVCQIGSFFEGLTSKNKLFTIRIVIITFALLCLIFGLIFGGTADVFTKASNICTECIGLG